MYGGPQGYRPQQQPDYVSGEQYRYALTNFRIAHEKVESQRQQLEEQERQVAQLKARIALLEGGDDQGNRRSTNPNQGGASVDDFSIRTAASKLERLINRWAADVVRMPPAPLNTIRDAALTDLEGPQPEAPDASPVVVQNLLRHAMSEVICEGIINVLVVTNSSEANVQLTRIHEHIFTRDPTVASVWRRQTFSAAVDKCSEELSLLILQENIPTLTSLLWPDRQIHPAVMAILETAYAFSRMLHGSRTSGGGITDAFYRAYVPELGNILYPRQIELVKRCLRSECGEVDRVGSCIFFGLVKMTRAPPTGEEVGDEGGVAQAVVRRAQVICECALGMVSASANNNPGMPPAQYDQGMGMQYGDGPPPPGPGYAPGPPQQGYANSPPPESQYHSEEAAFDNAALLRPPSTYSTPPPNPQSSPRPHLRLNVPA